MFINAFFNRILIKNYFIVVVFVFLNLKCCCGSAGQCPYFINNEIQKCVQPVADYAKILNQQENSSTKVGGSEFGQALQLPKLGGSVFKELCKLIRDFELCVEDYRDKCRKHITINLIEASYGFLCNEGYETFMASAECLMELDQRPSVKSCHDETLKKIEKANSENDISMPIKLDRMCEALNAFSGCVMNPIRQNCGLQAWQVIFRVLRDTTNTLMPACQFVEHSTTINSNTEKILYIEANPTTTTNIPPNKASNGEDKILAEWLYPKTENTGKQRNFDGKDSSKNSHRTRGSENRREDPLESYGNSHSSYNNQGQKYAQVSSSDIRIGFEDDPNSGSLLNRLNCFIYGFIICLVVFL